MNRKFIALAGRIDEALHDLATLTDRTERQLEKRVTIRMTITSTTSTLLPSTCTGSTAVWRQYWSTLRTADESMPDSPNWHRDLLLQMGADLADVRPAVITDAAYLDALGALFDVSTEFLFDLVLIEYASPRLQKRIAEDGLPL
ncbi:MAG: hypothetical protein R2854_14250 [Caldilineaceae bacterium]